MIGFNGDFCFGSQAGIDPGRWNVC